VLDRNGNELARSIDTDSVFVAPDELTKADAPATPEQAECTAEILSSLLTLKKEALVAQLNEAVKNNRRFIWIARRLPAEIGARVMAQKLPGVYVQHEPKRFYPNGSLAAHVLGFVGTDNIGLGGIEKVYNQKITGETG